MYPDVVKLHLTLLHSEWPKLYGVMTILSAIGSRNSIALRMAKTLWSFDHSECNRVKKLYCTQNGQNYGVLTILSAIWLRNSIALRTAKTMEF